jgi:hypothetical protein
LKNRYKIVPYRDVDCNGNHWCDESEEVVLTETIPSVDQYLTGIFLQPVFEGDDPIKVAREEWDWAVKEYNIFKNEEETQRALDFLESHPLLKR